MNYFGQPLPGKRCKCARCGFDGFHSPDQTHFCMVMVSLDELERHKKDAGRYRWLRDDNFSHPYAVCDEDMTRTLDGPELDAAIDAEMNTLIENIEAKP